MYVFPVAKRICEHAQPHSTSELFEGIAAHQCSTAETPVQNTAKLKEKPGELYKYHSDTDNC